MPSAPLAPSVVAASARLPLAQRRAAVVDAALAVMCRHGVTACSTRAVAAEAGVALATVQYAFRSKDELLRAVCERVLADEMAAVARVPATGDPSVAVRGALAAYWALVESDPDQHQVLYELTQHALRTPGLADVARAQYAAYRGAAAAVVEAVACRTGARWTGPAEDVARWVATALDGITLAWLVDRDGTAARRQLDLLADSVLVGGDGPTGGHR